MRSPHPQTLLKLAAGSAHPPSGRWWGNTATAAERASFKHLVASKRIEFVDNGWCQHDMGCTTVDSMLSNWQEGHSWLKQQFGEDARPRVVTPLRTPPVACV